MIYPNDSQIELQMSAAATSDSNFTPTNTISTAALSPSVSGAVNSSELRSSVKTKHRNNPKRQCNYVISNTTLDVRHKNQLSTFERKKALIAEHTKRIKLLSCRLSNLLSKPICTLSDDELRTKTLLNEELAILTNEVTDLQNDKNELEYFINTSDILFDYYNLLENNVEEAPVVSSSSSSSSSVSSSVSGLNPSDNQPDSAPIPITEYFLPTRKQNRVSGNVTTTVSTPSTFASSVAKNQITKPKTSRYHLLDDYLRYTDKNYINNNIVSESQMVCSYCKHPGQDILINEGIIYCRKCFTVENIITDNEKPSYKDPPKEISYFSYKRINHFSEWLNQIQGKETTDIPDEVFNKIIVELSKQRIYDLSSVTPAKIREILKKNKINKYYEHIPYILNKITGIPNPHLNPDLEDKLKNMFREIQVPFLKYSPSNRKNFLSYSYVLHKFIQLLNEHEFLKYFPLLKSRDKLHQQEQIWKKICEHLNWKFIRSI
jgi:hypothetical protein